MLFKILHVWRTFRGNTKIYMLIKCTTDRISRWNNVHSTNVHSTNVQDGTRYIAE